MEKIKALLWDIDGTILNFHEAQKNAIRSLFKEYNLGECDDAMLADYSAINQKYWEALERGELTKPQVLTGRFYEFFEKYGLPKEVVEDFNDSYQVSLGDTICFYPNAMETLLECKKRGVPQYIVTNGTKIAQDKKLNKSGIIDIVDGVFISDVVGYEKPSVDFFKPVLEEVYSRVPGIDKSEILIIGDSLTSDIQGGVNAQIATAWYKQPGMVNKKGLRVDIEINDLKEVIELLA